MGTSMYDAWFECRNFTKKKKKIINEYLQWMTGKNITCTNNKIINNFIKLIIKYHYR